MWTKLYKGFYINGYCSSNKCNVIFENGTPLGKTKSLHAAKLLITKFLGMCAIGNKIMFDSA